jgi:hypothetical protein
MMISVAISFPIGDSPCSGLFTALCTWGCFHQTRRSICNGQRVIRGAASCGNHYRYPGCPVAVGKAFEVESD